MRISLSLIYFIAVLSFSLMMISNSEGQEKKKCSTVFECSEEMLNIVDEISKSQEAIFQGLKILEKRADDIEGSINKKNDDLRIELQTPITNLQNRQRVIEVTSVTSKNFTSAQGTLHCPNGKVFLSCMALRLPDGLALCGSTVIDGGRTCQSNVCTPPAGQSFQLIGLCGRIP